MHRGMWCILAATYAGTRVGYAHVYNRVCARCAVCVFTKSRLLFGAVVNPLTTGLCPQRDLRFGLNASFRGLESAKIWPFLPRFAVDRTPWLKD